MSEPASIAIAIFAVLFIGVSKAGFGGGLGMLTTPLCVIAFGPKDAIGILLPLLCAGDFFSLFHYWKKWDARNLLWLMPGVVPGIVIGTTLVGRFSARELNLAIGIIAVSFVTFQIFKDAIFKAEQKLRPSHWLGFPVGLVAGITSTFAHGAGPVVAMFLIPQKLPKEIFVGTSILVFSWINWLKVPFFVHAGLIRPETLKTTLCFLVLIPVGVKLGIWLNTRFSEKGFLRFVFVATFITGIQLIFQFDLKHLFGVR